MISKKKIGFICILLLQLINSVEAQTVIPFYSGCIPGENTHEDKEYNENGIYFAVSKPDLTIYLPQNENRDRTAVLVCSTGFTIKSAINFLTGNKVEVDRDTKGYCELKAGSYLIEFIK